jgi:glutathione synthase/RimK-type ligase-like ATP-grasp enzyme
MQFAVVAHRPSDTNYALAGAAASLGLPATVLPPRDALRALEPGDIALGRLDVRDELDGVERGTEELEQLAASGVVLLNPPSALVAAHDKLLTARILRRAGIPHPRTWLIAEGVLSPAPELPVVLKPRFGSWGKDVVLCPTADELDRRLAHFAQRPWFPEQGVLAQELVPPLGWDLRIVVAGDVSSARHVESRHPANGERTSRSAGAASRSRRRPSRRLSHSKQQRQSAATSSASTCSRSGRASWSPR